MSTNPDLDRITRLPEGFDGPVWAKLIERMRRTRGLPHLELVATEVPLALEMGAITDGDLPRIRTAYARERARLLRAQQQRPAQPKEARP